MAQKEKNPLKEVMTPIFRLSFPKLDTPETIMGSKEKWFSMQMLFDKKENQDWIQSILKDLYKQKWGEQKRPSTFKNPWRDGDVKAEESGMDVYAGNFFMNAKAGEKDKFILLDGRKELIGPDRFYAGCYARAKLLIKTYDNQYGKGFNVWIKGIQFVRDGEALSGSSSARADEFEAVEGADATPAIDNDDF